MNTLEKPSDSEILPKRVPAVITGLDPDQHARMLDLKSFSFRHSLGNYPTLTVPGIQKLTERLLQEKRFDQVYCRVAGATWGSDTINHEKVLETIESLQTAGVWLRLTRVDEINEELRDTCETFYADLSKLLNQDIKSRVMKTFVTLFVSSPNAITPYHIDHTWNFLLQICGRKTVHLFDQNDPRILRQEDREAHYWNRFSIEQNKSVAGIAYELTPGIGAHHPVHAPHWVQNGPEISVSLSFGLCLHTSNDEAKIHQMNFLLRKLGMKPAPLHQSKWRDSLKLRAVNLISDRNPNSFDEVVFSGQRRMERALKLVRLVR